MNYKSLIGPIVILVFGLVVFTWFRGNPYLFGSDTGFPINIKTVNEYFYILPFNSAFGGPDIAKFTVLSPIGLLLKTYALTGLPYSAPVFERLWVYVTFAFSGISMYFLLTVLFPEKNFFARMFGSLVYMFNFFFMWLWIDLPFLTIAYAFFPLIFALYIKGIEEKKGFLYAGLLALLWTILLSSGYGLPWAATNWLAIISFLSFSIVVYRNKGRIKRAIVFTGLLLGSWIALNAFWLISLAKSFSTELSRNALPGVNVSDLFANNSVSISNGLRFLGPPTYTLGSYKGSLYFPWYNIYSSPIIEFISFFIPCLVVFSLFTKKRKNLIFFGLFTILFLFLVKGPNPPLGSINSLLFSQAGLNFMFRSVYQRFMGYVVLGSAVLITFSIDRIIRLRAKKKILNIFRGIILVSLAISIIVILPSPLWTGSTYNQSGIFSSRRVTIPNYYFEAANWVDAQDGQFNVLPLPFPIAYRAAFSWDNGSVGYYSKYPFAFISSKSFMINDFGNQTGSTFVRLLINNAFNDSLILNLFNIKYIFLHRDTNWDYIQGSSSWVSGSLEQMEGALRSMKGLVLEKTFGEIDVYRNTAWQPMTGYILPQNLSGEYSQIFHPENLSYFAESPLTDDFSSNALSNWSDITGNWTIANELGQFTLNGTGSSSLALNIFSNGSLTTEGYFKFGQTNSTHYPFVLTEQNGETFYPILASSNGYFVVGTGSDEVSNIEPYSPDTWYNITIKLDIGQSKYWIWVNGDLLTPHGLPIYAYGNNSVVSSSAYFIRVAIWSGDAQELCSTESRDIKIFDQSCFTTPMNQVRASQSLEINRINPTQYQGDIVISAPSVLIFNENYDPGWILKLNGTEYNPTAGLGFANAYSINTTGTFNLTLNYEPQNWFYVGVATSLTFLAFLVAYLIFTKRDWIKTLVR